MFVSYGGLFIDTQRYLEVLCRQIQRGDHAFRHYPGRLDATRFGMFHDRLGDEIFFQGIQVGSAGGYRRT